MSLEAPAADGRPGAGQLLASEMEAAAMGRGKRRDLKPLAKLAPFVQAHMSDAVLSGVCLLVSAGSTLTLTLMARLLIDNSKAGEEAAVLNHFFLLAGLNALVLSQIERFKDAFGN